MSGPPIKSRIPIKPWIITLALLSVPATSQAETVTLVCNMRAGLYTLDIDFGKHVISIRGPFRGSVTWPAQITDRFVKYWTCSNCGPNVIDRNTGILTDSDGSTGTCNRTQGSKF
jgi:hypothetical protein